MTELSQPRIMCAPIHVRKILDINANCEVDISNDSSIAGCGALVDLGNWGMIEESEDWFQLTHAGKSWLKSMCVVPVDENE